MNTRSQELSVSKFDRITQGIADALLLSMSLVMIVIAAVVAIGEVI